MINEEITSYIQAQLKAGTPKDIIREVLVSKGGWRLVDVEEAFSKLNPLTSSVSIPSINTATSVVSPNPDNGSIATLVEDNAKVATEAEAQAAIDSIMQSKSTIAPTQPGPTIQKEVSTTSNVNKTDPIISTPVQNISQPIISTPTSVSTPIVSSIPTSVPTQTPVVSQTPVAQSVAEKVEVMPTLQPKKQELNPVSAPAPIKQTSPEIAPIVNTPVVTPAVNINSNPRDSFTFVKGAVGSPEPIRQSQNTNTPPSAFTGVKPQPPAAVSSLPLGAPEKPAVQQNIYGPTREGSTPAFAGMQASQMLSQSQPKTSGKKIAMILGITLLVLLLGGGSVFGYFYYVSPTPTRALGFAAQKISTYQTGHYVAKLKAEFDRSGIIGDIIPTPEGLTPPEGLKPSENTQAEATLTIDGTFNRTDPIEQRSATTFSLKTTLAPVDLKLETRLIGTTLYAKVPELGFLADLIGGDTFGFLPGDWVKLSKDDVVSLASDAPELQMVPGVQGGGLTQKLTKEQQDKVIQLFTNGNIITPTVELSKSEINGVRVHRYQVSINTENLKQVLSQTYEITTGQKILPSQTQALGDLLTSFEITDAEIWVGVWDHMLHKIVFNVIPRDESMKTMNAKLGVDISFDSFGTPVEVSSPISAKPFISILEDARKKGKDASIKANIAQARATAEIYYSTKRTYIGLCESQEGLGQTINALTSLVSPGVPYCKDAARTYVIAAPLTTENSGFFCADNTGNQVSLATVPSGTVCK